MTSLAVFARHKKIYTFGSKGLPVGRQCDYFVQHNALLAQKYLLLLNKQ